MLSDESDDKNDIRISCKYLGLEPKLKIPVFQPELFENIRTRTLQKPSGT